ncbi:unnamed protein product [Cyprideis torosa]|uniref:Uncharacterized protein n=1 Tax=Cyprideis torosa TaxID=163714 RepID=A0A7R8WLQ3_9CRUS|nr:unnamed protein product [Cyprideis torosa]CAG0897552.1 unnamed protein product [Cyprideis torosa]
MNAKTTVVAVLISLFSSVASLLEDDGLVDILSLIRKQQENPEVMPPPLKEKSGFPSVESLVQTLDRIDRLDDAGWAPIQPYLQDLTSCQSNTTPPPSCPNATTAAPKPTQSEHRGQPCDGNSKTVIVVYGGNAGAQQPQEPSPSAGIDLASLESKTNKNTMAGVGGGTCSGASKEAEQLNQKLKMENAKLQQQMKDMLALKKAEVNAMMKDQETSVQQLIRRLQVDSGEEFSFMRTRSGVDGKEAAQFSVACAVADVLSESLNNELRQVTQVRSILEFLSNATCAANEIILAANGCRKIKRFSDLVSRFEVRLPADQALTKTVKMLINVLSRIQTTDDTTTNTVHNSPLVPSTLSREPKTTEILSSDVTSSQNLWKGSPRRKRKQKLQRADVDKGSNAPLSWGRLFQHQGGLEEELIKSLLLETQDNTFL